MKIHELAKKYKISVRTIRYYDELKLISSTRDCSNVRVFDLEQVERLELVLFFKSFGFTLSEVKRLLDNHGTSYLNSMLKGKATELDMEINKLTNERRMIQSILNTFGSKDTSKHNIKDFINEQIYFDTTNERMINMLTSTHDIIIEIGENLINCAKSSEDKALLPSIKSLREHLGNEFNIQLEPIRVRDNIDDLKPNEYRILQNNNTLIQKSINSDNKLTQSEHIIANLKAVLL